MNYIPPIGIRVTVSLVLFRMDADMIYKNVLFRYEFTHTHIYIFIHVYVDIQIYICIQCIYIYN